MEFEFRNREPLEPEKEEFARRVAGELEINADKIIVYPSNVAGLYDGRENLEHPVIALKNDQYHVIAHELGHDRQAQAEDRIWESECTTNKDGELTPSNLYNDNIESLTDEIYAEMVAAEYSPEGFTRKPVEHAYHLANQFGSNIESQKDDSELTVFETNEQGEQYLEEPDTIELNAETSDLMRDLRDGSVEELKDLLYRTWSNNINKCVVQDREDILWKSIDNFLDIPYDDHNWHEVDDLYEDEVRQGISDNFNRINLRVRKNLASQMARLVKGQDGEPPNFPDSKPNPSHLSPKVASDESISKLRNDFSHEVGNLTGRFLNEELGLTHDALEELDRESLESFAYHALELSMEMGLNRESYDVEDYMDGLDFLAEEHLM